jgi:PhnB protein
MHGDVNINGVTIAGSDQFGDMYSPAGNVSLMIDLDNLSDAQAKFTALAEEGQIIMPFAETFWAEGYGFCTDRFGIMWQINCTVDKAR